MTLDQQFAAAIAAAPTEEMKQRLREMLERERAAASGDGV